MKARLFIILSILLPLQVLALIPADRKQRLVEGWEFIRQDMGSVWEVMRPVPGIGKPEAVPLWESVTLPHCFNAEDGVDPDVNYYQGAGWYRTYLTIDNPYQSGRTLLEFEGAGQVTEVYVYTTLVTRHVGGYDEWTADITEAVESFRKNPLCHERFQGKIPIAIRCDNSRNTELIPSDMSDFNLYGGLYRYVNLVYTPNIYCGHIRIAPSVDEKGKNGEISITIPIVGAEKWTSENSKLNLQIISPKGEQALSTTFQTLVEDKLVSTFSIKKPQLWSPDSPALYICKVELITDGDTVSVQERFGFRHFRFEEKGPFYLNGKRLLLRGTHRHEDHAGVGAALTEEMMRNEMKQIKEMGANFIRLGHYQQSSIILNLCDELGLLVWEEIPWCRGGLGGETYKEQARRMLTNMIEQHYNHPSIILWGMGNENDWPGDFEYFEKESIRAFMSELHELSHRLDPSRLTCIRRCEFCKDIIDVYSPSIWAGWYGRRYRNYYDMEKSGFDGTNRFLHVEWGGDSHAGRHTEVIKQEGGMTQLDLVDAGDRNGDWSESYIVRLFDWHLMEQERMPWLTGTAFWTFKDFSTPLRPDNPIPYVNQKGVVQRDGTPKESYYVFQSYWATKPMVHIYGHSWDIRWGKADEKKEFLVYSNCPEVELFVNGVSQGRKVRNSQDFPAAGLHWEVELEEGKNQIKAVAYYGKKQKETLIDEIETTYHTRPWGKPTQLRLTQQGNLIVAELLDEEGNRCLDATTFIRFGCTHPEALLHNQGTANGSWRVQAANGRAAIRIKPDKKHPIVVSATCEGIEIKPTFIQL